MAIEMGLTPAQKKDFEALLQTHHTIEVRIAVLDLDHNEVSGDISARLLDGQVTVDADAAVTRGLDVDLLDPTGALHLDSQSPNDGALFADRMLRIRYCVINPLATVRYVVPIFTGPITKLERTGVVLKVEAQGKEVFGLTPAWNEKTFKKGHNTTSAIRFILAEMMGENKLAIPNLKKTIPRNVSVGGDKLPWEVAKGLAGSIGYQLFFDGDGVCRMRKKPRGSVFVFREGPGGSIKSTPDVGFDIDSVVNAVEVLGKKPKKEKGKTTKKRPHARAVAPRSHPLSPWALGRSGGPRYLPKIVKSDGVENNTEAKRRAQQELKQGLLQSIDVAYDTLVIPHLEEMDVVTCSTTKFSSPHQLKQFAIPLRAGGDMSVGYVRNVRPAGQSRVKVKKRRPKKQPRKTNDGGRR